MSFTPAESTAAQSLIELALREDLGNLGDLTSQALIPADLQGKAAFVARAAGVLAGLPAAEMVCKAVDNRLTFQSHANDGQAIKPGDCLATVAGPMRALLTAERTALNFMQQLSGVATLTARFVEAIKGLPAKILDTRKTTPGWRLLQKYAVRCGGGHNHRMGLYDGILIKDNHLAAIASKLEIAAVVSQVRQLVGDRLPIEVEVETLEQLEKVLPTRPAIVLLDNMTTDQLRTAVRIRDKAGQGVMLEASGGIRLDNVRDIAETGVDRISIGALTHSAPALDIALDYIPA